MRHFLRWAFDFSAVASAVLFVAVCVLWARSGQTFDLIERRGCFVSSLSGTLALGRTHGGASDDTLRWKSSPAADASLAWPGVHFKISEPVWGGATVSLLQAPHWCYLIPLSLPPFAWFVLIRRKRRPANAGLCPACGYDLRATPDAGGALVGRCPECGSVAPTRGAA